MADDDDWRARLSDALKRSGKSARSVELAARVSTGYLHDILKVGKEPTVGRLMRVVAQLDVSLSYILYGYEMSAVEEQLLQKFAKLSAKGKKTLLDAAEEMAHPAD